MQTARFKDGSVKLLEDMPPLEMVPMGSAPKSLAVDTSRRHQEIIGFGGAFTEAAALNWKLLSQDDQKKVISLYFDPPEKGGHGYTLGRVPINSCDFSPESYSFDDVAGDVELEHFDTSVTHDVESGMIPMILAAQEKVVARGEKLNVYASPWSPPAWMKLPAANQSGVVVQSMLVSAKPNGLDPQHQRPWAKYFSKFISAYRSHGIDLWGVTVQNEPEAAVGWEAMLWTPEYMASFVRDHLGPVLAAEQPNVRILGFDHNKDHVADWAKALYEDPEAAKFFAGMGVHWYGGLNTHALDYTHHLQPNKMILGTEACNCGGVTYRNISYKDGAIISSPIAAWWSRAESLALDILEDLRFWAVGWTDWNLVLSIKGGPNHLKNLCDANIIVDPINNLSQGTLIMQASYYYMGHFSRYVPPGSRRVSLNNSVELNAPPLSADDVKNGQALLFAPCDGDDVQKWTLDDGGSLFVHGTAEALLSDGYKHGGECVDVALDSPIDGKTQTWACFHVGNQIWSVVDVPGGSQIKNPYLNKCMTAVQTNGAAVGLDPGVAIVAAHVKPCLDPGDPSQTFRLANYDEQGFPGNFPVRTVPAAPGGGELCLQPMIIQVPHFNAVAFEQPSGEVSLITMNLGDSDVNFTIVDQNAQTGVSHMIGSHAIHTYRWKPTARAADQPDNEPGDVAATLITMPVEAQAGYKAGLEQVAAPALVTIEAVRAAGDAQPAAATAAATAAAAAAAAPAGAAVSAPAAAAAAAAAGKAAMHGPELVPPQPAGETGTTLSSAVLLMMAAGAIATLAMVRLGAARSRRYECGVDGEPKDDEYMEWKPQAA